MLYPHLNPKSTEYWRKPASKEAWDTGVEKTIKLDVLAKTVQHHLARDGNQPLTMDGDGQTVITNLNCSSDDDDYAECDQIVIFSTFPSSNAAIIDVGY